MPKVLVPLAAGFEEIETASIIDTFRRGGIHVTVAGISAEPQKGSRRLLFVPDALLSEVKNNSFDMIVLPGGKAGVDALIEEGTVLEILKRMKSEDRYIAAICAAPLILRAAEVIEGNQITSYPGLENELGKNDYLTERVVVDGKLITSRGPGTALEFALTLTKILIGQEKTDQIADLMLTDRV